MNKTNYTLITLPLTSVIILSSCSNNSIDNRTVSFDSDWKFVKNNPSGAEVPDFDDYEWRDIDLPHDWSIEDLPNQSNRIIQI